jgi:hypothetical protein
MPTSNSITTIPSTFFISTRFEAVSFGRDLAWEFFGVGEVKINVKTLKSIVDLQVSDKTSRR